MMLGLVRVGSGIRVLNGYVGFGATCSGCSVGRAGSAWSVDMGSGWRIVISSSGGLSSSVIGIGADSGSVECGASSIIKVSYVVGVGVGVVISGSSCDARICLCGDGGLESLCGRSTISISSDWVALLFASYW